MASRALAPWPRRTAAAVALTAAVACAPACDDRRRHGEPAPGSAAVAGSAAAPGGAAARSPAPDRIEGALTLDGKPLAITRCRPGRDSALGPLHVDMVTAAGALRFVSGEAARMFFRPQPDGGGGDGTAIRCAIPHRSWGGGTRADGTSYFRGELAFSCEGPPAISGRVSLDCGDIRPDERASLDEQRRQKREAQGLGSGAAATPDR